jgi:hypothetical protein
MVSPNEVRSHGHGPQSTARCRDIDHSSVGPTDSDTAYQSTTITTTTTAAGTAPVQRATASACGWSGDATSTTLDIAVQVRSGGDRYRRHPVHVLCRELRWRRYDSECITSHIDDFDGGDGAVSAQCGTVPTSRGAAQPSRATERGPTLVVAKLPGGTRNEIATAARRGRRNMPVTTRLCTMYRKNVFIKCLE